MSYEHNETYKPGVLPLHQHASCNWCEGEYEKTSHKLTTRYLNEWAPQHSNEPSAILFPPRHPDAILNASTAAGQQVSGRGRSHIPSADGPRRYTGICSQRVPAHENTNWSNTFLLPSFILQVSQTKCRPLQVFLSFSTKEWKWYFWQQLGRSISCLKVHFPIKKKNTLKR
jgi:hypothetical protein